MSLLGNYSILHKSPGRFLSGTVASGDRSNFGKSGSFRNNYMKNFDKTSAIPLGYTEGWVLPQLGGGMASQTQSKNIISITNAILAGGKNAELSMSSAISTTNALLGLIASIESNMSASISVTDADIALILQLTADLSASGAFTDLELGAITDMVSSMSAGMSEDLLLTALAFIECEITSLQELSPGSLANAVWSSIATDNNDSGTMGEKLNDAGSAGNPWDSLLVDNNTTGTFGWFIQKLLTVSKFLGLK